MAETRAALATPFSARIASRSRKAAASIEVSCGAKHGIFVTDSQLVTCRCAPCIVSGSARDAFTPSAFESHAGKGHCKNWKLSIKVPGEEATETVNLGGWLSKRKIKARNFRIGSRRGRPSSPAPAPSPSPPPSPPPPAAPTRTPRAPVSNARTPSAPSKRSAVFAVHPLPPPPLPAPDSAGPVDPPARSAFSTFSTFSTRMTTALQSRKKPKITGWRVTDSDELSVSIDVGSASFSGVIHESPKLMASAMDVERMGFLAAPTTPITFMTGVPGATMIIPPEFFSQNVVAWSMYCVGKHAAWLGLYVKWIVVQRNG